jgi:hypothetical protein
MEKRFNVNSGEKLIEILGSENYQAVSTGRSCKRQVEEKVKPVGRNEGKAMGSGLTFVIYECYVQHFCCIFKPQKVLESGLLLLSVVTE